MKHHTVLLIFLMVLVVGASALSASSFDRGIGAQAGQLSSAGLSFYQRLDSTRALQATVGLSLDSSYSITTDLDYGLGLEYQHTFFSASYQDWFASNLYWFIGLNHSGSASWGDTADIAKSYIPTVGVGAGFGGEPTFLSHFSLPVSFGYGVFYTAEGSSVVDMVSITFLAQIGARYRF
jgi:hypothetical protein